MRVAVLGHVGHQRLARLPRAAGQQTTTSAIKAGASRGDDSKTRYATPMARQDRSVRGCRSRFQRAGKRRVRGSRSRSRALFQDRPQECRRRRARRGGRRCAGDVETALAKYTELAALRPDDPMPRICIARMQLHDVGDPDAALDTIDAAFDFIDEEADLIEAIDGPHRGAARDRRSRRRARARSPSCRRR